MNKFDLEQRLEHTDLSSRSQIRASLRRDLLDRDHTRRPRAAWMLNAMALGIMAMGIAAVAVLMGRGRTPMIGTGGSQPDPAATQGAACLIEAGKVAIGLPEGSPYGEGLPTIPPPCPPNTFQVDRDTALAIKAQIETGEPTATIVPFVHTVQEGETLLMIVQMYGWEDGSIIPEVIALNGLASEADIAIGQTLLIPVRVEYPPFDPCNPTPAPTSTIIYDPSLPTATPFIFVITATPISDLVEPTATPMGAPAESTPIDSTWMPTVPPCIPSEGEFGPYDVITATPIPFDPNAPTVPPDDQMPTPTPMDWDATSLPTVPPAVEPTTTVRPQPQPTTATP